MSKQADRLMNARCRLMTREPFYGHVCMNMTWIPSQMLWLPEERRTMGVRVMAGGDIQCLYYPPFVDSLNIKELFAVIQHEIEHIVRLHCLRIGHRNHEAWNIACDMTINGQRNAPRIGYHDTNDIIIPHKDKICWIPAGWSVNDSAEQYYNRLMKDAGPICTRCGKQVSKKKSKSDNKADDKNSGQSDESGDQSNNCQSKDCPMCGQKEDDTYSFGGVTGKSLDDHSIWDQTDASADEARQAVKDLVDQASAKCAGNVPGHLVEAIKELAKPIVRWRELLRQYMGKHIGSKRDTFSRRNRRHDAFGLPGVSHHAASEVVVIVDTSGSVSTTQLEQFFAEIDAISSKASVYVLQWDHAFQGFDRYRRGDWKKFKVNGRGGTDMAAPIVYLEENKLLKNCQIMLTDGYVCDWAKSRGWYPSLGMITCITTPKGETTGPDWGHEVRLIINN